MVSKKISNVRLTLTSTHLIRSLTEAVRTPPPQSVMRVSNIEYSYLSLLFLASILCRHLQLLALITVQL